MELSNAGEHKSVWNFAEEFWKCWTGVLMMQATLNPQSEKSYMRKEKLNRGESGTL